MLSILDEIRRVRHEMSAEIGHDPRRIVDYYAELSAKYSDRLVNYGPGQKGTGQKGNGIVGTSDHSSTANLATDKHR